jgi:superfamily II DNA helicase RecQ
VVINEDTLALARNATPPRNLWLEASQDSNPFIFVSPEQLDSIPFNSLLRKKTLEKRWIMFGLDEIHLLNDWVECRKAFSQIGLVRARIPKSIIMGFTATSLPGPTINALFDSLRIQKGIVSSKNNPCSDPKSKIFIACPTMDSLLGTFLTLPGYSATVERQ